MKPPTPKNRSDRRRTVPGRLPIFPKRLVTNTIPAIRRARLPRDIRSARATAPFGKPPVRRRQRLPAPFSRPDPSGRRNGRQVCPYAHTCRSRPKCPPHDVRPHFPIPPKRHPSPPETPPERRPLSDCDRSSLPHFLERLPTTALPFRKAPPGGPPKKRGSVSEQVGHAPSLSSYRRCRYTDATPMIPFSDAPIKSSR